MEVLVLDTNLISVDIIDTFDSLIWTDRYFKCGDFEICTSFDVRYLRSLRPDYYLCLSGSEHVMIVEGFEINTDPEDGNNLVFTGRSLESILDRRIIWGQTILNGSLQDGVSQLLSENAVSPTIQDRAIPNLIFEASDDPAITSLTIQAQFTGDNLYDVIQKICEASNIGFKITLTDDNKFKFKLYAGVDRSYGQLLNPYVVFSPKFDNILGSNYIQSIKPLKTVTLIAGEGEGVDRKTTTAAVQSGGGSGLSRRELFTDARDISSNVEGGVLTPEEYDLQLIQRGIEKLSQTTVVSLFEGQIDASGIYKYGEDFSIGDVLQITNEYGMEARARVVELIHSQNTSGIDIYPTFATVE